MTASTKEPMSPAEKRWGYRFGVDGLVPSEEACAMLGDVTDRTLRTYKAKGYIRVGYRQPGRPNSGVVVCRRSLSDYLASLEH